MIKALRKLNEALPLLILTILIYGALVELIGVWFVEDKIRYTSGLLIGIALALFLSISIAMSVRNQTEEIDKKEQVKIAFKAVLRYVVVAIVSIGMAYFKLGNIITWFVGVMGLKVAAFTQPLIHRVLFGSTDRNKENP